MPNRHLLAALAPITLLGSCVISDIPSQDASMLPGHCESLPRASYAKWSRHEASNDWFEVYEVAPQTYAIYEPFQWQEVISYLIVGDARALLFDSGNGIGDIKNIVDRLTRHPVTVLNSHSHIDHIGGNYQFDDILTTGTPFSVSRSTGASGDDVQQEVTSQALCKPLPNGLQASEHVIRPYTTSVVIGDGDKIDLGSRVLEVMMIPGHTDDSVALLERKTGYLWTGDTYYAGPVWLFAEETDLLQYRRSLERLAALIPELTTLFPAHNTPAERPEALADALRAFDQIMSGEADPTPEGDQAVSFYFGDFGYVIRKDLLPDGH